MIGDIVSKDPEAIWIVEGAGYPITNFPLMRGARTINSTNVYPHLKRWRTIDNQNHYSSIYNRYAHIKIDVKEEDQIPDGRKFELIAGDYFRVYLTYEELKSLNVRYIFTQSDLENEHLTLINQMYAYRVYRLD